MTVCLYGASSSLIDSTYISATEELGEKLAKAGNSLVYGGGANGIMGAAARGFVKGGGKVIGVAPTFFKVDGVLFEECTEFIYTETMRERKKIMEERADAFIAAPGGIGTFDELFEILSLKQLGRHNKPIVIFNVNGYYDSLLAMLDNAVEGKFMTAQSRSLLKVADTPEEIIKYLTEYNGDDYDFSVMRKVKMN